MEDSNMRDFTFANLPTEILIKIFQYLEFYDILSVKLCCKHWLAVTLLKEFETCGIFKISSGILDNNHPAAKILMEKQIKKLFLKSVFIGNADELFEHIGISLKELTLKLVPMETVLPLTMKYLTNLQCLKVCNVKMSSLVGNVGWLNAGNLSKMQKLCLIGNDSDLNKYILNSVDSSDGLINLTIEFGYKDELYITDVIEKHSKTLQKLDLRYYQATPFNNSKWGELFEKLKLTKLSLQGNIHPDIITFAIETQKSLKSIDLTGSVVVDDNCLFRIGRKLPKLERLILDYCGRITNRGVNQLATLSQLRILDLTGCNKLNSLSVHGIIGRTTNSALMELHLQDVNLDESDVCFCANNLPNLKIFNLSGCSKAVTDKSIQEIFDCLTKLECLKVDSSIITDNGIIGIPTGNSIQNLESLQELSLRSCKGLTDFSLTSGLRNPRLKFLDIANCEKITVLGLKSLVKNCSTIEKMHISSTKEVGSNAIYTLTSGLGRLRLLTVENCRDLSQIKAVDWTQTKFRPISNQVTLSRNVPPCCATTDK